ncbi:hypothetical protein RQP46_006984 [Phenoliferia psychrophenolica]
MPTIKGLAFVGYAVLITSANGANPHSGFIQKRSPQSAAAPLNGVTEGLGQVGSGLSQTLGGVLNPLGGLLGQATAPLGSVLKNVAAPLPGVLGGVGQGVAGTVKNLAAPLPGVLGGVAGTVNGVVDKVGGTVGGVLTNKSPLLQINTNLKRGAAPDYTAAIEKLEATLETVKKALAAQGHGAGSPKAARADIGPLSGVTQGLGQVGSGLSQTLGGVLNPLGSVLGQVTAPLGVGLKAAVAPLPGVLGGVGQGVAGTVKNLAAPLPGAVSGVLDPVHSALEKVTGTVGGILTNKSPLLQVNANLKRGAAPDYTAAIEKLEATLETVKKALAAQGHGAGSRQAPRALNVAATVDYSGAIDKLEATLEKVKQVLASQGHGAGSPKEKRNAPPAGSHFADPTGGMLSSATGMLGGILDFIGGNGLGANSDVMQNLFGGLAKRPKDNLGDLVGGMGNSIGINVHAKGNAGQKRDHGAKVAEMDALIANMRTHIKAEHQRRE